jgi:hypothetical protein
VVEHDIFQKCYSNPEAEDGCTSQLCRFEPTLRKLRNKRGRKCKLKEMDRNCWAYLFLLQLILQSHVTIFSVKVSITKS